MPADVDPYTTFLKIRPKCEESIDSGHFGLSAIAFPTSLN
jgi:hypothetical protein